MQEKLNLMTNINNKNIKPKKQIVSILVKNKSNALFEITKTFSEYALNIESLTVGKTQNTDDYRITVIISCDPESLCDILNSLSEIDQVISISLVHKDNAIGGELMMIKVSAQAQDRPIIQKILKTYNAQVVDISQNHLMVSAFGPSMELDELSTNLQKYGIVESARTGYIALEKGDLTSFYTM